ncbi:MAG TPA: hypothetical protein PKO06_10730, partial [Candidatus Ozemobacteraceae bacterium]|nr:hypothetical protein [Candidatus Ozemobacteraceae bacterium]
MQLMQTNRQLKWLVWALAALSAIFCVGSRVGAEQGTTGRDIRIKVAEYPSELECTCAEGGIWKVGEQQGTLVPGARCRLVGRMDREADKTYHVVVESAPLRDPARVEAAQQKWANGPRPL